MASAYIENGFTDASDGVEDSHDAASDGAEDAFNLLRVVAISSSCA